MAFPERRESGLAGGDLIRFVSTLRITRLFVVSMGRLTVLAREERLATQHLRQNAAHRPYVDRLGVFLKCQHDLRRTVPSGSHIFCHEARVVLLRRSRTSQAEIADFQIAISVEQEVGWLEISVEHIGGMHGLESTQSLVDEVLAMIV